MEPIAHLRPPRIRSLPPGTLAAACRGTVPDPPSLLGQSSRASRGPDATLLAIRGLDAATIDTVLDVVHAELVELRRDTEGGEKAPARSLPEAFREAQVTVLDVLGRALCGDLGRSPGPGPDPGRRTPTGGGAGLAQAGLRLVIEALDAARAGSGERLLAETLLCWQSRDDRRPGRGAD